jgi:hypothetical protein
MLSEKVLDSPAIRLSNDGSLYMLLSGAACRLGPIAFG